MRGYNSKLSEPAEGEQSLLMKEDNGMHWNNYFLFSNEIFFFFLLFFLILAIPYLNIFEDHCLSLN